MKSEIEKAAPPSQAAPDPEATYFGLTEREFRRARLRAQRRIREIIAFVPRNLGTARAASRRVDKLRSAVDLIVNCKRGIEQIRESATPQERSN